MSHFTADAFKTLSLMTYMIVITFDYDTCRCEFFFFFSLSSDICWVYCRHILMDFFKPNLGKIQLLFLKKKNSVPFTNGLAKFWSSIHVTHSSFLLFFRQFPSLYLQVCWVFLCTAQIYPWAPLMNFSFQFYFSTPEFLFGSLLYRQASEKLQVRFQAISVKKILQ